MGQAPPTLGEPETSADTDAAAAVTYASGEQIAGRYQVVSLLGRGASGTVYHVLDLVAHEEIAVKLFDASVGLEQLRAEVRAARRVTHENVVRVFDLVEHRRGSLLAMEYVAGGTLADRLGRRHDDDEVRRLLAPLLDGLEAVHRAGIVHRDLKPANVLLGAHGRVRVSDFGLARHGGPALITGESGLAGTPAYMAPEQLTAGAVDARADLYAVGLIAHELVTGRLPFVGPGEIVTLAHALRRLEVDAPPVPASALAPAIARLLARRAEGRPADVSEARRLLGLGAPRRPGPRRRAALALTAVGLGAGALAALIALIAGTRPAAHELRAAVATATDADAAPASAGTGAARPRARLRLLTSGGELLAGPAAFTPDGAALVTASARGGAYQLWWIDPAGSQSRPLTDGKRDVRSPHFAGDTLHFERRRPDGGWELVRVPMATLVGPTGAAAAEVVHAPIELARAAPDGTLALVEANGLGATIKLATATGERVVFRSEHAIVAAAWSRDGRTLAFAQLTDPWNERGALWILDAATGDTRQLVDDVPVWSGLAWGAGAPELLFLRGQGEELTLAAIDVERGATRVVATGLARITLPAVSADGKIALALDQVEADVWIRDRGATTLRRVTSFGEETAASPAFVDGGAQLAYVVARPDGTYEARRVRTDAAGTLTARRAIDAGSAYVAFTPDGREVVYGRRDAQGWAVVARRLDGDSDGDAAARVLTRVPAGEGISVNEITADGTRVTYARIGADAQVSLWEVALAGGAPRQLIARGAGGFRSRNGGWLGVGRAPAPAQAQVVHAIAADGRLGPARQVPNTGDVLVYRFGPGRDELVAANRRELFVVDIIRGTRRTLATLPAGVDEPDRLSVLPDGRIAIMLSVGGHTLALLDGGQDLPP